MFRRTATFRAAALGCLLTGLPCLDGAKLCIGFDGHLGVKDARDSCSLGAEDACAPAGVAVELPGARDVCDHACGPCVDIPFPAGHRGQPVRRPVPHADHLSSPAAFPASADLCFRGFAAAALERCSGAPPGLPARYAAQTAVLLI